MSGGQTPEQHAYSVIGRSMTVGELVALLQTMPAGVEIRAGSDCCGYGHAFTGQIELIEGRAGDEYRIVVAYTAHDA